MELSKYVVDIKTTLIEVLKKIDKLPSVQTVFVTKSMGEVVGTITDGDIRRGLIKGLSIENPIIDFVYKDFSYLKKSDDNFEKLKEFRARKLKAVPFLDDEGKLLKIYDFNVTKSILPIDAVIMAGGKGERLRPLTEKIPKPLLKIGGREIISYNLERLFHFGITNQYVTVNYLGDQIEEFCRTYNDDIDFHIIKEKEFLGTAGSLSLVENFQNDVILLINSDLLTNIDYEDYYKTFVQREADIMVASIPYQVSLPYAIFETTDRHVKSFREKPNYTYYANAGIYMFKKEILSYIPHNKFFNATDLMNLVIKDNKRLLHYPIRSYWLDIGKHEDFEKAQKDIAHIDFE